MEARLSSDSPGSGGGHDIYTLAACPEHLVYRDRGKLYRRWTPRAGDPPRHVKIDDGEDMYVHTD
jgi:hypothetical protein